MKIIIGHSNIDIDCLGSMALARYIYPDHKLVISRHVHPVARNLYNLYETYLKCLMPRDLEGQEVEDIVVVDTRNQKRIEEYFKFMNDFNGTIRVWDHHPSETQDIECEELFQAGYGANTTIFGMELIKRDVKISIEDATIALAGIYADTGNFTHENVRSQDFEVAAYLIENGASVGMVGKLLKVLKEKHQITLFHDILNRLTFKSISGNLVVLSYIEMEEEENGLAAVVEKVFEIENPDAIFSVFHIKKCSKNIIIARSKTDNIDLNNILSTYNGGGHKKAASATVKDKSGLLVFGMLEELLNKEIIPAKRAEDIMEHNVKFINESKTLLDASLLMEKELIAGLPVLSDVGELVGIITLRDIMKGRKKNQMESKVKVFMSKNVITTEKEVTVRDVENTLFTNNIGHLPVVKGKSLIGIITRSNLLDYFNDREC